MNFYDLVKVAVKSGKGGDGVIAGRREKYVPFGGPSGGDGGEGGSVFVVGSKDEWTLMKYRYSSRFYADDGESGQSRQMYGRKGDDKELIVPLGSVITHADTGELLAHIKEDGERICISSGGRGGWGNMHFVTPSNQYPSMALYGEPGEKFHINIELQLVGDVSLIGFPSVGKSSLINSISNVKAKTAEYHFTTLVPNVGVVESKLNNFIVVDVPGLIEGASEGKGLGNHFLRHILKSRIFCFLLDGSAYENSWEGFELLWNEIAEYITLRLYEMNEKIDDVRVSLSYENSEYLMLINYLDGDEQPQEMKKKVFWVFTKQDLIADDEIQQELLTGWEAFLQQAKVFEGNEGTSDAILNNTVLLSSATRFGVDSFLKKCDELLLSSDTFSDLRMKHVFDDHSSQSKEQEGSYSIEDITVDEKEFLLEEGYIDDTQLKKKIRYVSHPEIGYYCAIIPWGNVEAEFWFRRNLQQQGLLDILKSHGAKKGDILKIIPPYQGSKEKYILRD